MPFHSLPNTCSFVFVAHICLFFISCKIRRFLSPSIIYLQRSISIFKVSWLHMCIQWRILQILHTQSLGTTSLNTIYIPVSTQGLLLWQTGPFPCVCVCVNRNESWQNKSYKEPELLRIYGIPCTLSSYDLEADLTQYMVGLVVFRRYKEIKSKKWKLMMFF